MTIKGRTSRIPVRAKSGHHDLICNKESSDRTIPNTRHVAAVTQKERSAPTNAPARAGTTSKV